MQETTEKQYTQRYLRKLFSITETSEYTQQDIKKTEDIKIISYSDTSEVIT